MKRRINSKSTWPALGLLVAWLVLAGGLSWQRTRESVLPPVWDQLTYVQKAEGVWSSILKGNGGNLLNVEPSVRPPGTVLLTAPFGPLKDVRSFYFRSVFVPVAVMAAAVFIVGVGVTGQGWQSALIAMIASSMAMFWQFEISDLHYTGYSWGMVDTFQASLAGLAMAGLVLAALRYKRNWLIPSFLSLALLPLIKPSGFLIGSLISLAWLVLAIGWANLHPRGSKRGWDDLGATGLAIILVFASVLFASFSSKYFSNQNIEFGKLALEQLRGELFSDATKQGFGMLFTTAIGLPQLTAVALLGISARSRRSISRKETYTKEASWMAVIGILIFLAGIAMTYQATLFRQTRYFFPVLAIATVLFTPTLVAWSNRCWRLLYSCLAIIPISLLISLATPRLNHFAFNLAGYGLFTGFGKDEIKTANLYVDQFRFRSANAPVLFSSTEGISSAAFEAAIVRRLQEVGFDHSQIKVYRPFSWESGGLVKIDSIYNADLIALERPFDAYQLNPLKPTKLTHQLSYNEEIWAWKGWLAATPSLGSTEAILNTPRILILAVKDRSALEKQMRDFKASRLWRPEFLAVNGRSEFVVADISQLNLPGSLLTHPVEFGDAIRMHALSVSRPLGSPKIDISVYSEKIGGKSGRISHLFFIHQLDAKGKIISSHSVPLVASRLPERPISLARFSFKPLSDTVRIGLGIFEPSSGSLPTDWPRATEWRGRRASFDVKSLPQSSTRKISFDH